MIKLILPRLVSEVSAQDLPLLRNALNDLSDKALQSTHGTYTGNGVFGREVPLLFPPQIIIIGRNYPASITLPQPSNLVFCFSFLKGLSFVATNIVSDGVLEFTPTAMRLGGNAAVNLAGASYFYYGVG